MRDNTTIIDLHCHTTASDGLDNPTQLIERASNLGIDVIAITDHDSISGLVEGIDAGLKLGVEVIPGIELSTIHLNQELHLLGYFFDYKNEDFQKQLGEMSQVREERAQKIIGILNEVGYKIGYNSLRKNVEGNIGKPHIAREIINDPKNTQKLKSVFEEIPSISTFIQYYMVEGKIANVPKKRLSTVEGVKILKKFGWSHSFGSSWL